MKVRAAILREIGLSRPYSETRPIEVDELDLQGPRAGEVLIVVHAAGLCHSDLSAIDGVRPRERTPLPIVLGHEAMGTVLETGPGGGDLKAGDRVVTTFVPSCGRCVSCMEGRPGLCEPASRHSGTGMLIGGGTRLSRKGQDIHHYVGVAAFAEKAVVDRRSLVKIDRAVHPELGALFGCAVLTGVGAVINTARLRPGETAAIIGLGGVGLSALLGARLAGARAIVAVDIHEEKLRLARELGATHAIDARQVDCIDHIRELTGGGVNVAFEMAGAPGTMKIAYGVTRRGGTTVTASFPPASVSLSMAQSSVVGEERTIKGSYFGSSVPVRDIPRLIDLFASGHLPVDRIAGENVKLEDLNRAFDLLADGSALRQVVVP